MNLEKIYRAVNNDDMNSPLITIVTELKKQGYSVKIEGVEVDSGQINDELFNDLEKATNEYEVELSKGSVYSQKFKLVFNGFHQFSFQPSNNY